MHFLSKLCTPAMVYLVLAAISIIMAVFKKFQLMTLIVKVIFVSAWTWFLNFLCSKGYKAISWFLVLLPFLIMLGVFVMAAEVVKQASAQMMPPTQQKEGFYSASVKHMMGGQSLPGGNYDFATRAAGATL